MLLFSRQFEWRNQIWPNTAVQCTFCTGQRTFCTVFPSFLIEIFSLVGKTVRYVRCAMQNVHCAVVLDQIWLRHSNCLKKEAFAENFNIISQKLKNKFCNYLDRFNTRTREAHAVGSMGMLLAPAALWQHDKEAYQRFLKEWRWYLSLMQNHKGEIQYIGGKRNNGGDSYLGKNRIACVIALMIASPPNLRLRIFHRQ